MDIMDIKPGGWSKIKGVDEAAMVCYQVKSLVERKTNKIYQEFRAVEYRDETVNGKKYLFKVHVGGPNYIHLFVFQALPCNGGHLELLGVQEDKTKEVALETFNN